MVKLPIMTVKKHRAILTTNRLIIYKQQKEINELYDSNDSRAFQINQQREEITDLKNKLKEKEIIEENLIDKVALISTKLVRLQKEYDDLKEGIKK